MWERAPTRNFRCYLLDISSRVEVHYIHNAELLERLIPEGLMQVSKTYQRQRERILRENTINHISVVLKAKFPADIVNALTPVIQNISDVQRLEELHYAAARGRNIEAFVQLLNE